MFESSDESKLQPLDPIPSATPVQDALHDTMHLIASECSEVQGYSIEQIMTICSIARRTAFKYAAEVLEVWYWLPEYEFRVNGVYSEFALAELKRRKALGNLENYQSVIHRENAEVITQFKASQQQQTEPVVEESGGQLAKAVSVEVVPSLVSLQENLYKVGDFGASRLALANERLTQTGQDLNLTLDQTREAMRNLALQKYQTSQADEAEKQQRLNAVYMQAYQEELALIQARNMAREDARMQALQLEQAMGKVPAPNGSSVAS